MKHNRIKYISSYSEFKNKLNEQDAMGGMPMDPTMGGAGPPAPVAKEEIHYFLFIDHPLKKKKIKDYEDGGYTKRYTSYKVGNKELEEWLDKNIKEEKDSKVDKDDILNAITGERFSLTNDEVKFLDKFRIQVTELKRIGEENVSVDIYFDKKKEPSTNDLTVTFLDTEPSKK
jgi:hypothetical protein